MFYVFTKEGYQRVSNVRKTLTIGGFNFFWNREIKELVEVTTGLPAGRSFRSYEDAEGYVSNMIQIYGSELPSVIERHIQQYGASPYVQEVAAQ